MHLWCSSWKCNYIWNEYTQQVKPYTFDLQWLCFHKGALVYVLCLYFLSSCYHAWCTGVIYITTSLSMKSGRSSRKFCQIWCSAIVSGAIWNRGNCIWPAQVTILPWRKIWFFHGCKIKSESGLGTRLTILAQMENLALWMLLILGKILSYDHACEQVTTDRFVLE